MASFSEPEAGPLLSVVIPVFNELKTIDLILAAVRAVDLSIEIIVVDDSSTDGTRDRLDELEKTIPPFAFFTKLPIKAKARHCGPDSPRLADVSSSCRTLISNTIRKNIQSC